VTELQNQGTEAKPTLLLKSVLTVANMDLLMQAYQPCKTNTLSLRKHNNLQHRKFYWTVICNMINIIPVSVQ